jgi:hypothetical protein
MESVREGKKKVLPDWTGLVGEEPFAEVTFLWTSSGVQVGVSVQKSLSKVIYPEFRQGDALELFFDTRDIKTAILPTKFCHHFILLPEEVNGVQGQERVCPRTDDPHPLADPSAIGLEVKKGRSSYAMEITLPASILYGFTPETFPRLGFSYVLHREGGKPQHFSSPLLAIEGHPYLWPTLMLEGKK